MEMLIFYVELVHELSPLIKYHPSSCLVVNSKDTQARQLATKPTQLAWTLNASYTNVWLFHTLSCIK